MLLRFIIILSIWLLLDRIDFFLQTQHQEANRETQTKVMNVLLEWIKEYWQDFALDAALLALLNV